MRPASAVAIALGLLTLNLPAQAAATDGSAQQTLINQDRASAGLAPLAWSSCLYDIALQNAQRIAGQGYLSHTNGPTLDMACGSGATQAGENVAYTSAGIDDAQANTMFMNSAPHRANILGSYNYVATAWVVAPNGYGYIAEEFLNAPSLVPTWDRLAGNLTSAPAVTSWGSNRLDVFARGQDMALYHRSWDGTSWSAWSRIAASMSSAPAAVASGSGHLDVFARGQDMALYHISTTDGGTTWSAWQRLAASMTSAPAVASWGAGRLDVFGRGQDMALYHISTSNGGGSWSTWERLPGSLTSDPAAVSSGPGRFDVFARGNDLAVYQRTFDSAGWHEWVSRGGRLASAPAVSSWGGGRIDLFAMGSDMATYHLVSADGQSWQSWVRLAGPWTSAPAAASQSANSIDVFERGQDMALYHDALTG
jgi:hypothetical protein